LGISTVRERLEREEDLSLVEEREELLLLDLEDDLEEEEDDDLEEDLGTSRMFSSRPVVGSTVESSLGLWAMW
jgi:hypothetical protein